MHSWDKSYAQPNLKGNQGYVSSTYAQERINL